MRILHTSDLHIGRQLYDFSLMEDQKHLLDWLVSVIIEEKIDAVILAGDIYNRPQPSSDAIDLFNTFLSTVVGELSVPIFAIAGNHDGPSWLAFGSSLYQSAGYHIAGHTTLEIPILPLKGENINLWLMPYLHPSDVRSLLPDSDIRTFDAAYETLISRNLDRMNSDAFNIIVGHGFFSNLSATGTEKEMITSESENNIGGIDIVDANYFNAFDYVALGHLHAPQWVTSGKARYSGSPLKYSLSEEKQSKSITILDIQGKEFEATALPVPALRDVRRISGSLEDLLLPAWHQVTTFDDYVFAEIIGMEQAYAMQKLRVLFPNLLGLSFSDTLVQTMPDIEGNLKGEKLSTEDLFSQFYEEMKQEALPETHRRMVQSTLLALEEESR